ncbi:Methyl-accepting chemotaxis protein IV [bioreactor metagenome]|uniref:Methyl-accepting chemotaxis protein IV n=1 Tax=bioreactor metagenome TaxID=1076179 RepID=A0A644ZAC5_9ZZZZ
MRALAAKSAEASRQTAELLQRSAGAVTQGEHLTQETALLLQDMAGKSDHVTALMDRAAQASAAQASAIAEISLGLSQISAVVQSNAAAAEESSASSEELFAMAAALREELAQYRLARHEDDALPGGGQASLSLETAARF